MSPPLYLPHKDQVDPGLAPVPESGIAPQQAPQDLSKKTFSTWWTEFTEGDWYKSVPLLQHYSLVEVGQRLATAHKIKAGTATQEEMAENNRWVADQNRETTFGYDVASSVAQLPGFLIEFAASAGLGKLLVTGGKAASKAAALSLARSVATKAATGAAEAATEGWVGKSLDLTVSGMAKAAGRTAAEAAAMNAASPFNWATIAESTTRRMTDTYGFTQDEAGRLQPYLNDQGKGDDFWPAILKATGANTIENFAALSGGAMNYLYEIGGKAGVNMSFKMAVMERAGINIKNAGKIPAKEIAETLEKTGWSGIAGWAGVGDAVIGGTASMRVGDVLRYSIGMQDNLLPSITDLATEALSFGIVSAGHHGAKQVRDYKAPSPKVNNARETREAADNVLKTSMAPFARGEDVVVFETLGDMQGDENWQHLHGELEAKSHEIQGAYSTAGKIFLFADQLNTVEDVRKTLVHEVFHSKFAKVSVPERMDMLKRTLDASSDTYKRELATALSHELQRPIALEEAVDTLSTLKTQTEKSRIADEMFANIYENRYRDKTNWERLKGVSGEFLNSIGLGLKPTVVNEVLDQIMSPNDRAARTVPLDTETVMAKLGKKKSEKDRTTMLPGLVISPTKTGLPTTDEITKKASIATDVIEKGGTPNLTGETTPKVEVTSELIPTEVTTEEPVQAELPTPEVPEEKTVTVQHIEAQTEMLKESASVGILDDADVAVNEKEIISTAEKNDNALKTAVDVIDTIAEGKKVVAEQSSDTKSIQEETIKAADTASVLDTNTTALNTEARNIAGESATTTVAEAPLKTEAPPKERTRSGIEVEGDRTKGGLELSSYDYLDSSMETPEARLRFQESIDRLEKEGPEKVYQDIINQQTTDLNDRSLSLLKYASLYAKSMGNTKLYNDILGQVFPRESEAGATLQSIQDMQNNNIDNFILHGPDYEIQKTKYENRKGAARTGNGLTKKVLSGLNAVKEAAKKAYKKAEGIFTATPEEQERATTPESPLYEVAGGKVNTGKLKIVNDVIRLPVTKFGTDKGASPEQSAKVFEVFARTLNRRKLAEEVSRDTRTSLGAEKKEAGYLSNEEIIDQAVKESGLDRELVKSMLGIYDDHVSKAAQSSAKEHNEIAKGYVKRIQSLTVGINTLTPEAIEGINVLQVISKMVQYSVDSGLPIVGIGEKYKGLSPLGLIKYISEHLPEVAESYKAAQDKLIAEGANYEDMDFSSFSAKLAQITANPAEAVPKKVIQNATKEALQLEDTNVSQQARQLFDANIYYDKEIVGNTIEEITDTVMKHIPESPFTQEVRGVVRSEVASSLESKIHEYKAQDVTKAFEDKYKRDVKSEVKTAADNVKNLLREDKKIEVELARTEAKAKKDFERGMIQTELAKQKALKLREAGQIKEAEAIEAEVIKRDKKVQSDWDSARTKVLNEIAARKSRWAKEAEAATTKKNKEIFRGMVKVEVAKQKALTLREMKRVKEAEQLEAETQKKEKKIQDDWDKQRLQVDKEIQDRKDKWVKEKIAARNKVADDITKQLREHIANKAPTPLTEEQIKNRDEHLSARDIVRAIQEKNAAPSQDQKTVKATAPNALEKLKNLISHSNEAVNRIRQATKNIGQEVRKENKERDLTGEKPLIDITGLEGLARDPNLTAGDLISRQAVGNTVDWLLKDSRISWRAKSKELVKSGENPETFLRNTTDSFVQALSSTEIDPQDLKKLQDASYDYLSDKVSSEMQRLRDIHTSQNLVNKLEKGKDLTSEDILKAARDMLKLQDTSIAKQVQQLVDADVFKDTEIVDNVTNDITDMTMEGITDSPHAAAIRDLVHKEVSKDVGDKLWDIRKKAADKIEADREKKTAKDMAATAADNVKNLSRAEREAKATQAREEAKKNKEFTAGMVKVQLAINKALKAKEDKELRKSGQNLFNKLGTGEGLSPREVVVMSGKINKELGVAFSDFTHKGSEERSQYIAKATELLLSKIEGLSASQAAHLSDAYAHELSKRMNKDQRAAIERSLPKHFVKDPKNAGIIDDIINIYNSGGDVEKKSRERINKVVNEGLFDSEYTLRATTAGNAVSALLAKEPTEEGRAALIQTGDFRRVMANFENTLNEPLVKWQDRVGDWMRLGMISGPSSLEKVVASNIIFSGLHNIMAMAINSKWDMGQFAHMMSRYVRSISSASAAAMDSMGNGDIGGPMISSGQFNQNRPLPFPDKGIGKLLNFVTWSGRFMNAADVAFTHASYECKALQEANTLRRQFGIEPSKASRDLTETVMLLNQNGMYNKTDENGVKKWQSEVAKFEALQNNPGDVKGMVEFLRKRFSQMDEAHRVITETLGIEEGSRQYYRDMNSIMFDHLDEAVKVDVQRYIGTASMNIINDNNYYKNTTMGQLASTIMAAKQNHPSLNFVYPFVTTLANVYNFTMDYTPWGFRRAYNLSVSANESVRFHPDDLALLKGKAWLGTSVAMGLGMMAIGSLKSAGEDEEPAFELTGMGSSNPAEMARMKANGWRPYSIKVGNAYIDYRNGPLGIMLGIVGNALDAYKYNADKNAFTKMSFAIGRSLPTLIDNSFLSQGQSFYEIMAAHNDQQRVNKLASIFTRSATSLVVPNFFRQLERLYDDKSYSTDSILGDVIRQIPVVDSIGKATGMIKPRLNALGEPIHLGNPSILLSIAKGTMNGIEAMAGVDPGEQDPGQGWLSSLANQDPAWAKISRLGLKIPLTNMATNKIFGVEMSAEESYELAQIKGSMMKTMVNSIDFEVYDPKSRQDIIDRFNSKYTNAIKQYLLMKRLGAEK